jgi:catechol 2,3-dioxygenase-like lactoylglutathione lyase family enzyme
VQHVSTAPQTLPETIPAAAGVSAFYFRDPDGHNLELISFPADKGEGRWQAKDRVFLGIDHTALAVADTDVSAGLYVGALGMQIAGESLNFGTEQEHLNGVFGCRVRITGLRADAGIGVEFLDYRAPLGGRAFPSDTRANDLWHWEITLVSDDLDRDFMAAQQHGGRLLSSGIIPLPSDNPFGYGRGFALRDHDGHALRVLGE